MRFVKLGPLAVAVQPEDADLAKAGAAFNSTDEAGAASSGPSSRRFRSLTRYRVRLSNPDQKSALLARADNLEQLARGHVGTRLEFALATLSTTFSRSSSRMPALETEVEWRQGGCAGREESSKPLAGIRDLLANSGRALRPLPLLRAHGS